MPIGVHVLVHFLHYCSYILSCFVFHAVLLIAIDCVAMKCKMSRDHLLVVNTRVERPTCLQWCLETIIPSCKYNCHEPMFCNMHVTKRLWQWYGIP